MAVPWSVWDRTPPDVRSDWDEVFAELEAEIGTRPPRALHAEKADVLLLGATGAGLGTGARGGR